MNKTANCLKMLQYLNSGRVYKISELAERLETNPRNIIEYRNELENAGYVIISIAGKYGGYKLDETSTLPTVKLTADEKLALVEGAGYLAARNDFLHKAQYESAMSKVYSAVNHTDNREVLPTVITRFPLAMSEEELASRYNAMLYCITNRQKVQLEYRSNDNVVRKRVVHPYKLYMYNNAWFIIAFCELVGGFRYFKLNRIVAWTVLPTTFRRLISYDEHEMLDKFGMTKNGDWYKVKLKFTGKFAMVVQDYLYGRNQVTECVDQNTTILTLEMQYRDTIVGFILSHGTLCEVLEPQWLKDEVKNTALAIANAVK